MKFPFTKEMFLKRLQEVHSIEFEEIYFAVPDIHGHAKLTKFIVYLLEKILMTKNVVFLGDFIDKGIDSIGVVNNLYAGLQRNPEWVALRGNHEDMFLQNVFSGIYPVEKNNLISTCNGDELNFCFNFFNTIPIYCEIENLIFMHGVIGKSYDLPLTSMPRSELLWSYGVNRHYKGKMIVRGHSSVDSPTESSNSISCHTPLFYGARQFCISIIANKNINKKLLGYLQIDVSSLYCVFVPAST